MSTLFTDVINLKQLENFDVAKLSQPLQQVPLWTSHSNPTEACCFSWLIHVRSPYNKPSVHSSCAQMTSAVSGSDQHRAFPPTGRFLSVSYLSSQFSPSSKPGDLKILLYKLQPNCVKHGWGMTS